MQPKPKKCRNCTTKFIPSKSTQVACSYQCAIELSKAKVKKEGFKQLAEKVKTLSDYEAEAKAVFQRFIRLRDEKLPCISCGNQNPTDWAGGHYFSAGTYSGMIFDEDNCHGQCNSYCNMFLHGNLIEYRAGLIKRYGEEFVNSLESRKDAGRNYKYTKAELIEIKEHYAQKIKDIIKQRNLK